jgi:hypothetical protein
LTILVTKYQVHFDTVNSVYQFTRL